MKIVNRQGLMTMKPGVVFFPYEPAIIGNAMRKADTIQDNEGKNIDFFYFDLGPQVYLQNGEIQFERGLSRDGCYCDEDQYIVLDEVDVNLFVRQLLGMHIGDEECNQTAIPWE